MTIQDSADGPPRPKWYRKRWVQFVAVGLTGLIVGGVTGSGSASDADARAAAAQSQVASAQSEAQAADARAQAAEVQTSAANGKATDATAAAEAKLKGEQAALDQRSAALDDREKKIGGAEAAAKANTFAGDGVYIVGQDIQPGTYKSTGGELCYWARHNKNNEILDNHAAPGATVVVVLASDFSLEVKGCADYTKSG